MLTEQQQQQRPHQQNIVQKQKLQQQEQEHEDIIDLTGEETQQQYQQQQHCSETIMGKSEEQVKLNEDETLQFVPQQQQLHSCQNDKPKVLVQEQYDEERTDNNVVAGDTMDTETEQNS